ncbi:hypothetical protein AB0C69_14800 [Actinomadura sp. NPDC048032]|uniref:hypothetical protein n=1 Tax=Actinomadura sp. NPDC048032 TaxID=3155747 RepID=UPI0033D2B932
MPPGPWQYGGGPQPGWGPPPGPPRPPSRGRRLFRLLNPVIAGRQVARPTRPDRVDDPVVRKVQVLRAVVGLIAVVWIMVAYRVASDAQSLAYERADQIVTSATLLPATVPIIVGAFILGSRQHVRALYLRRTLKPLGSLVALVGTVLFFVVLTSVMPEGGLIGDDEQPSPAVYAKLLVMVIIALVTLWAIVFVFFGAAVALVHVFRTADIHEVLPPIIATVLVWELAIMDLFSHDYDGLPVPARLAVILGGPLSVTLVSLWELRRLRTRHHLTVRRALGR